MKKEHLDNMTKGWFVGGFSPTAFSTQDVEVGVKQYVQGDKEEAHYHKIAHEITLVLEGKIKICGQTLGPGEIIVIEPEEVSSFEALTDARLVVVKSPGALDDKYRPDRSE